MRARQMRCVESVPPPELPGSLLRLLPAGAVAGWGSHHWKARLVTAHTLSGRSRSPWLGRRRLQMLRHMPSTLAPPIVSVAVVGMSRWLSANVRGFASPRQLQDRDGKNEGAAVEDIGDPERNAQHRQTRDACRQEVDSKDGAPRVEPTRL